MTDLLSLNNPVFAQFAMHSVFNVAKMFSLVPLGIYRKYFKKTSSQKPKLTYDTTGLDRVARNHRNDMENMYAFCIIGLFYVLTNPSRESASWHFRIFTVSRIGHMISFQVPIRQPARGFCYAVGLAACLSMIFSIVKHQSTFF